MSLDDAQREVQTAFLGGSVGQVVTGLVWLLSAALSTWVSGPLGILALFLGGMLIFPLTQLALRLVGSSGSLSKDNPLGRYPLQSVFAMTALYPLIYVVALHNRNWFYPAFMIVVGSHYVSFIHLYGMWQYGVLAAALVAGGIALLVQPLGFSAGGWLAGVVLLLFAAVIAVSAPWRERRVA